MSEITPSAAIRQLIAQKDLTREQARSVFNAIMEGLYSESQIAGLLVALAAKGETVEEIAGAAEAMRAKVVPTASTNDDVIDTCGTGGTGISTFNVSTCAAFVAAGCGAKVAKHGNRTNTRASGSANVLAELGVNIECTPEVESRCLDEAGVCFCFAVKHHPAMKYAVPVRKQLGVRTIFNVLGPLTNPAGAKRQLMGVPSEQWVKKIAQAHSLLGATKVMVVHAKDGLDEISITAPTLVAECVEGKVHTYSIEPDQFGLCPAKLEDLLVTSAEESADAIRQVLAGTKGPARDIVLLNAAAALVVAGKVDDIAAGIPAAAESIDSGTARAALERLIELSKA